jgi:phenylacetate-CoA ligase
VAIFPLIPRWAAGLEALVQAHNWTREELAAFQSRRLRALVRHAARNVPYYRRLFQQAGLRPEDIRSPGDLHRIPVTSRQDLQSLPPGDLVAEGVNPERLIVHFTSGTSGEPLVIRRTFFEEYLLRAFRLREQLSQGLRLTDRRASLGMGSRRTRAPGREKAARSDFRPWLARRENVYCLQSAEEIRAQLRAIEPDVLTGHGSGIAEIAALLTEEDRARFRPRLVLTSAETIPFATRQRVSKTLRAPVFDTYASHEFNVLATECPRGGCYHVAEWSIVFEVLRDGRPVAAGEQGEVMATALHSFAMPFIRYRLNDLVILGKNPCACGAPVATIESILGRTIEQFILPDGRRIHPYVLLGPLLVSAPWLSRYQIVQDRVDHVRIRLISRAGPGAEAISAAVRAVAAAMDGSVRVDIELVDDIPAEPNGKYRPYYTLVR